MFYYYSLIASIFCLYKIITEDIGSLKNVLLLLADFWISFICICLFYL